MRAAQFFGRRDVRVVDVAEPTPEPYEVIVAVEWAGICGTDMHEYLVGPQVIPREGRPHPVTGEVLPVTLGHEFCGRVVRVGDGKRGLEIGEKVMVDPRLYCGRCGRCGSEGRNTNMCDTWGFKGLSGGGGGFSEMVAVKGEMCYPLPEEVPMELAALIEPLAVAERATGQAGVEGWKEKTVLILGGGPVGIAVSFVLRAKGVGRVVVSEPTKERKRLMEGIADVVVNPLEEDVGKSCRGLTSGEGVDVVFDCAGVQRGMDAGMDALRFHGTYVNVAGWEKPFAVPLGFCMMKEITVKMSFAYNDEDFSKTVQGFIDGKFKGVEKMVTSRIGLEDIVEKGFEELVTNKDEHIKILVTPKKSQST